VKNGFSIELAKQKSPLIC